MADTKLQALASAYVDGQACALTRPKNYFICSEDVELRRLVYSLPDILPVHREWAGCVRTIYNGLGCPLRGRPRRKQTDIETRQYDQTARQASQA